MLSSDLPITEWWDPAWDVYDVPLSPYDHGVDYDTWWACYELLWMLSWIEHGTEAYIPMHFQHQLTTGHGALCSTGWGEWCDEPGCPLVARCECWPLVTRMGEPPEMEQNPDCPLHWAPSYLYPCSCEYVLRHVHGAPGPYVPYRRPWIRRPEWLTRCFVIDPDCVWHGDEWETYTYGLEGAYLEPPEEIAGPCFYVVLDEWERGDR